MPCSYTKFQAMFSIQWSKRVTEKLFHPISVNVLFDHTEYFHLLLQI